MIATPPPSPMQLDQMMSRSWRLFKSNLSIAVPMLFVLIPIVVGLALIAIWVINFFITHPHPRDNGAAVFVPVLIGYFVMVAVTALIGVAAVAAMYGMANAAWERGHATFADGTRAARTRFGAAFVATFGFFCVSIVAMILLLPTLGLSLLALPVFTMYVYPAVVVGHRGGFAAIAESFRLVKEYFATSVIAVLVLVAIQYAISFLAYPAIMPLQFSVMDWSGKGSSEFPVIPVPLVVLAVVGYVVVIVAMYLYQAFYAIAITGLYRSLLERTDAQRIASPTPG